MGIYATAVIITIVVMAVVFFLAIRFLSGRARLVLYGVILIAALGVWGYVSLYHRLPTSYELQPYISGFSQPVFALFMPDESGRVLVLERGGTIHMVRNGVVQEEPFLDLTEQVNNLDAEQGLFSLALHPEFAQNGYFYVYYTLPSNNTILQQFQMMEGDENQADPASAVTVLEIEQPTTHHNGGHVIFGPDGYLYLGLGDGGSLEGEASAAQELSNLLGTIVRLDVSEPDAGGAYAIPADNPFIDVPEARPEIWFYGLRNPWRFTFDPVTDDLYIADVGNISREEINYVPAGSAGGLNFGWRWYEGTVRTEFPGDGPAPESGLVAPIAEYTHLSLGGCSITGGYVYRGTEVPDLVGKYVYGDFCSGFIWALAHENGENVTTERLLQAEGMLISSFAVDNAGELYVIDFSGGTIYRLVGR